MIWTAFTLAFLAFLRCSDFTYVTYVYLCWGIYITFCPSHLKKTSYSGCSVSNFPLLRKLAGAKGFVDDMDCLYSCLSCLS